MPRVKPAALSEFLRVPRSAIRAALTLIERSLDGRASERRRREERTERALFWEERRRCRAVRHCCSRSFSRRAGGIQGGSTSVALCPTIDCLCVCLSVTSSLCFSVSMPSLCLTLSLPVCLSSLSLFLSLPFSVSISLSRSLALFCSPSVCPSLYLSSVRLFLLSLPLSHPVPLRPFQHLVSI